MIALVVYGNIRRTFPHACSISQDIDRSGEYRYFIGNGLLQRIRTINNCVLGEYGCVLAAGCQRRPYLYIKSWIKVVE